MGKVFPFIGPLPLGLFANLHTLQFFGIGEVDIEACQRRESFLQYQPGYLADVRTCRFKISVRLMVAKGESDGRHSFQASLYHNAHRTGIMQVYRRIVAVVDAAYHQVGLAVEHRMKSQLHTVGRRTGTLVYRQSDILTDQLVVDRFRYCQRTRTSGAGCIRRHYHNLAQRTEEFD